MSFDVINGYANDLVAAAEKFEATLKAAQDSEDTSYIRWVHFTYGRGVVEVWWLTKNFAKFQKLNVQTVERENISFRA